MIAWTCGIESHEHADEAEAAACIDWLRENWSALQASELPIRAEFRAQMERSAQVLYLGDVQRLALRPGDVVVLRTPHVITMDAAARLRELAEQELPGHKVLVLSEGLEIGVLGRSEAGSDP